MSDTAQLTGSDAGKEGFFGTLVDALPEAVIVSMPDGTITYFNKASEALLEYRADEVVGQNIAMLVPQQPGQRADPLKWLARWAAEPQHTQSRFLNFTGRTKSGRLMPVDVRVSEGRVDGEPRFFITVRDNTARREEMAAYKEAHLKASRILAVAEDAIVSIDEDERITFFNLKAEQMFGYRAEEVLGKPLDILLPERFRAGHHGHIETFGRSKLASKLMAERPEIAGLRRDGEEFPIEASITKVNVGWAPTFTAHVRDITKEKAAREALEESERRFKAIFEHAYEAIGLLDPHGTVLEINRAGRSLTEGATQLQGLPIWDLPWVGDETNVEGQEEGRDRLKQAVADAAGGETVRYEVVINAGKPGERKIDLSLIPVKDESGKVVYIIPEGRDMTGAGSAS